MYSTLGTASRVIEHANSSAARYLGSFIEEFSKVRVDAAGVVRDEPQRGRSSSSPPIPAMTRSGDQRKSTWPHCRPIVLIVSPRPPHESLIDHEADSAAASMAIHDVVASDSR
jgi:hypothetical protein